VSQNKDRVIASTKGDEISVQKSGWRLEFKMLVLQTNEIGFGWETAETMTHQEPFEDRIYRGL